MEDSIQVITTSNTINLSTLKNIAANQFGYLVKAIVDIELCVMAIGGELHADEEVVLSEQGSRRENTWGINLYPDKSEAEWIEFDSMVNIKPQFNNKSRKVENENTQTKIREIVNKLVNRAT